MKEPRVRRQAVLEALVELQCQAVNRQQTRTIRRVLYTVASRYQVVREGKRMRDPGHSRRPGTDTLALLRAKVLTLLHVEILQAWTTGFQPSCAGRSGGRC